MSVSEIISYLINAVLVGVAIWQTRKNSNLRKYLRSEAMELYSDMGILLGSAQTCLHEFQAGNTNLAAQAAGRAEGMAQALFARSIKNIYHHFKFTRNDVDHWINTKKILGNHKDAFLGYAEE